jgi:hypothetical protein
MTHRHISAFAIAASAALAATGAAHATFVLDTSCGTSSCNEGTMLFIDTQNSDVSTFGAAVGGAGGPAVTVDTTGNVFTGSGFATIKPTSGATLTDLIFTPANDTLFSDFSFRGQLEPAAFTGAIDVKWTDSTGTSGVIPFSVPKANQDFNRLGIVSNDGETLKSVEIFFPSTDTFKEVKQVEFSFAAGPPIPELSTWVMVTLGFGGLGYAAFRRKRRDSLYMA